MGGRVTPAPLGYDSRLDAAHHLDSLPAALLSPNAPNAGLTPSAPWELAQLPGVGSRGLVGRKSVAAPSLTQAPPPITRPQLVLAVLAILALSAVTAEYARDVLLHKRPLR